MKDKAFEKVTEYIDAMAEKLGVAAEHVYGILVKQQIAEGVLDTCIGVVALALFIALTTLLIGAYTKAEYEDGVTGRYSSLKPVNAYAKLYEIIDDTDGVVLIFYIIAQVILLAVALVFTHSGILSLINPEYYAIKELLEVVGGGK